MQYNSIIEEIFSIITQEDARQARDIELIASENFVSDNIKKALGSNLTNKYTEGYPEDRVMSYAGNKFSSLFKDTGNRGRYYGGCKYYDQLEQTACNLFRTLFNTDYHVNVQPHSGSNANYAAYAAVLKPGDKILSMSLNDGGHLTHGSSVNFSGKLYDMHFYGLTSNGIINYDEMEDMARKIKPRLILAGASAYSREIDYQRFAEVADSVGAYFMVDMAHVSGIIATGELMSPFGLADIITTTTQKILRGPRGGLIFCKPELAKKIDSAVFPGIQGGPLQNVIAAKAICAAEALQSDYVVYISNVLTNAKAMANEFINMGYKIVSDGTDNHMFVLDLSRYPQISGNDVQKELEKFHITANKNCIPNDTKSPKETSGIRIGTPAMTTKGFTKNDFITTAQSIDTIIRGMMR